MRYSRMKEHAEYREEKRTHRAGSIFFILLIAAAVIYIIAATKVGDHLSQKVIAPVVNYFSNRNSAEESVKSSANSLNEQQSMVSAELSFPAIDHYLLQYGIFGSSENAKNAAVELKGIGGAGYLREEEGKYRVIISGYATKDDAENVKERLQNDRGMESKLLNIAAGDMTCSIACESDYAEKLKTAADDISSLHSDLLDTILSLDSGSITQEAAIALYTEKRSKVEAHYSELKEISQKTDDVLVGALNKYFNEVSTVFAAMDDNLSGAALSSAMKRVYIGVSYAYRDLLQYDTND